MKLYTARYFNKRVATSGLVPIGISVGLPRFGMAYELAASLFQLGPTRDMLKLPADEYVVRYRARLEALGADRIRQMLSCFGDGQVLLCFEDLRLPGKNCHRRQFAAWWQEKTGEVVPELDEEPDAQGSLF